MFGRIVFALVALIVAACEPTVSNTDIAAPKYFTNANDAEQRWKAHELSTYTLMQRRLCECVFRSSAYRVQVSRGLVTSVVDTVTNRPIEPNLQSLFLSVDELFAEVRKLEDQNRRRRMEFLAIQYDSLYGYPRVITVDVSSAIADEEYSILTSLAR